MIWRYPVRRLKIFLINRLHRGAGITYADSKNFTSNKVYIILGTGRSGTSFIADSLAKNGVDMGSKSGDRYLYHCENQDFKALNRAILKKAGGTFFKPPSRNKILNASKHFKKEITSLIASYEGPFWGFKDPRSTITIEAFLPYIKGDVYFICCLRDLDHTTKSFMKSEKLSESEARKLIRTYTLRLMETIEHIFLQKKT